MKVKHKQGDIIKGLIEINISKTEVGVEGALVIVDYYRLRKNKYALCLYLSRVEDDTYYNFYEIDADCLYSKLTKYIKEFIENCKADKTLQNAFKQYMQCINSMLDVIELKEHTILSIVDRGGDKQNVWNYEILDKINKITKDNEQSKVFITSSIIYKEQVNKAILEISIIGMSEDVYHLVENIEYQRKPIYEIEVTYDRYTINMIIKFTYLNKQLEVLLIIKNSNKYVRAKLEEYMESKSINRVYNNTHDDIFGMDGITLRDYYKQKAMDWTTFYEIYGQMLPESVIV